MMKHTHTQALNPHTSVSLNGEIFEAFLVKSGTREGYPLTPLLVNIILQSVQLYKINQIEA